MGAIPSFHGAGAVSSGTTGLTPIFHRESYGQRFNEALNG